VWPEDVEHRLHVREIDGPGEVGEGEDQHVVAASTFKVAVALTFFQLAAEGVLDAAERIVLAPGARTDRKSTRLNSSHMPKSRMPSSA